MRGVKIAFVGAGYMAREHARAFAAIPGVEIVGFHSRTRSRATVLAAGYGARVFESIEEMYRETEADGVVVAVNELSMETVCQSCFKHPWLCLLEKPVGIDLVQATRIAELCRRSGTRAYVALNRRSYSSTRQALVELAPEEGPRLITVSDQQDMTSAREGGQPDDVVQNYMFANSIHLIDYFNVFARGRVATVQHVVPWRQEAPGFVVAAMRYTSGDIAVYQAVWDGPGPWAVTVTNSMVRVEMRPLENLAIQRRGERRPSNVSLPNLDVEFKPGLFHQATEMVAILNGSQATLATLDDALCSMSLCAQIYGRN